MFALDRRAGRIDGDAIARSRPTPRGIETIRADRAAAANRYFAGHAEVGTQMRSLHVAESEVERRSTARSASAPLGRLVDIGTGTGRMIELFGPRREPGARHRPPPGNAPPRPRQARSGRASRRAAPGRHVRAAARLGSADTVIIHQVLHYAQSPAAAVAEAARLLAPGGAPDRRFRRRTSARSCAPPTPMSAWASTTRRCRLVRGGRARRPRHRASRRRRADGDLLARAAEGGQSPQRRAA